MKKNTILTAFLIALISLGSSCSKDFSELNTDPNTSEKALPRTLLAHALVSVVNTNMSRTQAVTNELMQVTVNNLVETDRIFRYDIKRTVADASWNTWYLELTNIKDIYKFASESPEVKENKSFMGISLICQTWLYSLLTDTYGDVPYFNSNKGKEGIFTPEFDRQKDIYTDMFKQLEAANELLKDNNNVTASSDPVFGGKAINWRKFGNSLYLRLLLRISGKAELANEAIAKIKEIVDTNPENYPVISSNVESAVLRWTGAGVYTSPFANTKESDWRYPRSCSFFVDKLDAAGDPCISKWVTLVDGLYEGIPSGYVFGQTPVSKSYMPYSLMTEPLTGNIMNYSEVQFILAEAAAKGWITSKTAQNYYETGITNRITLWGLTVPAGFLTGATIKWDDNALIEDKMELILTQKYFALFFTDLQSWFEYRRTSHPILPVGPGLQNNGVMPARLYYPQNVQTANSKNYNAELAIQGPDDLSTQVWWQKP